MNEISSPKIEITSMKNLFFILLFLISASTLVARGTDPHIQFSKAYTLEMSYDDGSPVDYATEITAKIISVLGLKPNFEVKAAQIPNAAAVVYQGKRYLDWQLDDPADESVGAIRPLRDEIERRVLVLLGELGVETEPVS